MAKPKRRGSVYYGQVVVPKDLWEIVGAKTKERSLKTNDREQAKRLQRAFEDEWTARFDDLRARRALTADDKAQATWTHYEQTIVAHEAKRAAMPTPADIEAEEQKVWRMIERGEITADDHVGRVNANADLELLLQKRALDRKLRERKLAHLKRRLADGDTSPAVDAARSYLEQGKLLVDEGSEEFRDLCRRMMRAEIEGLERTLERDQGDYTGAPRDPIVKPTTGPAREQARAGEGILELFERYARENPKRNKPDTLNQSRRDVQLFADVVGNMPVSKITKRIVSEWKALVMLYPVKASETKAFSGMTMRQIVKANEKIGKPTISDATVNRYLSAVGAFCSWLVRHGYLEHNPVDGLFQMLDKGDRRKGTFTSDQLNTLFRSPLFTGCQSADSWRNISKPGNVQIRDHRFWVPLLMLFTGARTGEVAQLLVGDVRKQDDRWIIYITETGDDDKSVKNKGSWRVVPVHPELIRLGFLKHRDRMERAGETRLFPEAERNERGQIAAKLSKAFKPYLAKLGITHEDGLSLYSCRHGVVDRLREAGYKNAEIGILVGHSGQGMTKGYGRIPEGTLQQRVELVEAITYPGLKLDHLEPA